MYKALWQLFQAGYCLKTFLSNINILGKEDSDSKLIVSIVLVS